MRATSGTDHPSRELGRGACTALCRGRATRETNAGSSAAAGPARLPRLAQGPSAGRRRRAQTPASGGSPRPLFQRPVSPPAAPAEVSGWPEPARTGHRLGRVRRKRPAAAAPPPASRLGCACAGATYVVCIAARAGGRRRRAAAGWVLLAPV